MAQQLDNRDWDSFYKQPDKGEKYVFISYSRRDEQALLFDAHYLVDAGVKFWIDPSINDGEDWKKIVSGVLNDVDCVGAIFYVSANSVKSESILWELQEAQKICKEHNQEFKLHAVVIGEGNVFQCLQTANNEIVGNKEHFYKVYMEVFPSEKQYILREKRISYSDHIGKIIEDCEQIGARDVNKPYSKKTEFTFKSYKNGYKIEAFNGTTSAPRIPTINTTIDSSSNTDNRVIALGAEAFKEKGFTSVEIPEGVEEIGDRCFRLCEKLEEVHLPSTLKHIGYEAFCNCTSLKKIVFPKNVKYIGDYCFYKCTSLESIEFEMDEDEVSNEKLHLGFNCFQELLSLTKVVFPHNFTIGKMSMYCFNKCEKLKTLQLPTICDMEDVVVHNCPQLYSLEIMGNLPENYNGRIVKHCPVLHYFMYTAKERSVSDVGEAFGKRYPNASNAMSITETTILEHLKAPQVQFDGERLEIRFKQIKDAKSYSAEIECGNHSKRIDCFVPQITNGICVVPVCSRTNEQSESVVYFEKGDYCVPFAVKIRANGDNVEYADSEYSDKCYCHNDASDFIEDATNPAILAGYNGIKAVVRIPEQFEIIGSKAFAENDTIESLSFAPSVKEIGEGAFYHCTKLKHVDLEHSNVAKIGKNAFAYCEQIAGTLVFPSTLSEIEEESFNVCSGIETLDMSKSKLVSLAPQAFRRCIALKKIVFPRDLTVIDSKAFRGCTDIILQESNLHELDKLERIEDSAFSFLMYPNTLTLPVNVKYVASNVLYYSTGAEKIDIAKTDSTGKNVLPEFRVENNTLLTVYNDDNKREVVTFPINADCVRDGEEGKYVMPYNVCRIRAEAYRDLEKMCDATIDEDVEVIEKINFSYCWKLTKVTLGKNVKRIEKGCFAHNPVLQDVYITGDLPVIDNGTKADEACFVNNASNMHVHWGKDGSMDNDVRFKRWLAENGIE